MKTKIKKAIGSLTFLGLAVTAIHIQLSTAFAQAQSTTITYQGQLNSGAGNANGSYDLRFAVYDANVAGNFIAGPLTNSAVTVSNGLFTVALDFGAIFTGTNYWVEMGVRTNGGGSFATLVPRQQLTPAPSAFSLSAQSPHFNALCPPGAVMAYLGTNPPAGWLLCNGQVVSRTTYTNLFAVIGTSGGAGNGSNTFVIPDLRGRFLRGASLGSGNDPDASGRVALAGGANTGDTLGSYQADTFGNHNHGGSTGAVDNQGGTSANRDYNNSGSNPGTGFLYAAQINAGNPFLAHTHSIPSAGGSETRPKNVSVNYIIKY